MLESQLRNYASQGPYPMHMPGHKRSFFGGLPYGWDVTEVPGTDDLHDAHGILRDAMNRTAALYGAAQTWYLVNGSTVGILAGIRAIAPYGCEVIVARNCHKAVYHAIELQNLTVHWVWPSRNPEFDIYESVDPQEIARTLDQYPETRAVILTSPTYEGVVSDIPAIAQLCHHHGIPLFVDEAHGAHLGFHEAFPDTAIHQGADLVVQSPHKTLPALTQAAWLHLGQNALVTPESIDTELDIFETSSPSYILMSSLDTCTGVVRERGPAMFDAYVTNMEVLWRLPLRHLRIYTSDHHDPSKILISGRQCGMTGEELARILREEFHIETEMHLGCNVLAMTSICDTKIGIQRLADALKAIDKRAQDAGEIEPGHYDVVTEARMTIADALRGDTEQVTIDDLAGRVAAEYVYAYPPGIPSIVPGEIVTPGLIRQLQTWNAQGTTLRFSAGRDGYRVVKESL